MTQVTLSQEAVDAITADGIRDLRATALSNTSEHVKDQVSDKMIIAACEMLLAYMGERFE